MPALEERVFDLERMMAEVAHAQMRTEMSLNRLSEEMREFKEEMSDFKNEMTDFKNEAQLDRKRLDKAWGDLANKLGTIVEDIVAPNIRRLAITEFGFSQVDAVYPRPTRRRRRGPEEEREFDLICVGPERVIVAESKSTTSMEKIEQCATRLPEFFDFFPELDGRELIGVVASWNIPDRHRQSISELGLYGVAMGENTMQIVARPAAAAAPGHS